jgi:DNA-binding GntR family transcriptional regulator
MAASDAAPSATDGSELAPVKQAAYDRFREALFDGRLRPGQFVSQRELVVLLGLSIGALRELLPRLQAEGLLRVMPQRGIQVTQIDLPMIRDAFQFRMAVEREAVLFAVERMPEDRIAEQMRLHEDTIAAAANAVGDRTFFEAAQKIDDGFHMQLVRDTGNDLLFQAYAVNAIRIRLIRLDRISLSPAVLPTAFADHLAIIRAIGRRDASAAVATLEQHIRNARDRATRL